MAKAASKPAAVSPPKSRTERTTRIGVVTSSARNKSIKVMTSFSVRHEKYSKYLKRRSVYHAHDERNEASNGDTVEIAECRPISKTKHWRLLRIITKGPAQVAGVDA